MLHGILRQDFDPSVLTGSVYKIKETDIIIRFVAPLSILSNQPAYSQDAMNLQRKASSQGVQRWEITTNLEPFNDQATTLVHSTYNGVYRKFYATMPQVHGLEFATENAFLAASYAAGTATMLVGSNLKLNKGEFINFGVESKVYLVVEASNGSITISPPLLTAIGSDILPRTIRRGRNAYIRVRYDSDTQVGIVYTDGVLSDHGSVKLIEAL